MCRQTGICLCPRRKEGEVCCVSAVLAWELVADLQGTPTPGSHTFPTFLILELSCLYSTNCSVPHFPIFFGGRGGGGRLVFERE